MTPTDENEPYIFCGEPHKYVWTVEQVEELDKVLSEIFDFEKEETTPC